MEQDVYIGCPVGSDQAGSDGVHRRFGARVDPQLGEYIAQMDFDSIGADVQPSRNFLIGGTSRHQLQDLKLTLA
jgi:hypothetical protein